MRSDRDTLCKTLADWAKFFLPHGKTHQKTNRVAEGKGSSIEFMLRHIGGLLVTHFNSDIKAYICNFVLAATTSDIKLKDDGAN